MDMLLELLREVKRLQILLCAYCTGARQGDAVPVAELAVRLDLTPEECEGLVGSLREDGLVCAARLTSAPEVRALRVTREGELVVRSVRRRPGRARCSPAAAGHPP